MACPSCGGETPDTARYCPWCGAAQDPASGSSDIPGSGDQEIAPASRDAEIREIRAAANAMSSELARLLQRLSALERGSASSAASPQQPAVPSDQPSADADPATPLEQPPSAPVTQPTSATSYSGYRAAAALEQAGLSAGPAPSVAGAADARGEGGGGLPRIPSGIFADWNWEWLLGGNWLARIGIVALIFGVAFFISLAIDRGWLGELERVVLGLIGGLAFLGAGEYYRKRYAVWAQTVTGGGIAIFYLSVYGAFALYGLISTELAFGVFALITLAGALLSLRHEAVGVAVLSILGGFATPLLLREQLPDQRLLLVYVLVLDVGVLALAGFRNWRWFTLLAWAGSLVVFAFWQMELEPPVVLGQIGITAIFIIFAGATVAFHIVRQQAAGIADLALVTLNATGYYGISYALIYDPYRPWMGGFTALVAVFYVLLAAACRMRGPEQLNLTLFSAGLAVVFAVLAVPIQLGGPWVSVAWGVEALVLVWLSFPLRMRELRWAGYAMFAVSAVWLLAVDSPGAFRDDLTPFLNYIMLAYGVVILASVLSAWLLWRKRDSLEPYEQAAYPVFAVGAALVAAVAIPIQLEWPWITVAWAAEALVLLRLSFTLQIRQIRWFGYVIFATFCAWLLFVLSFEWGLFLFFYDWAMDWDAPRGFWGEFTPFLNWHMLEYGVAILASIAAGYLLWRRRDCLGWREQPAYIVFATAASALAVIAVPVQLDGVWVSIAWSVEAMLLTALASGLRLPELRWSGYILLAVILIRLLAVETFDVNLATFLPVINWRFLSFAIGIAALYSACWLAFRLRIIVASGVKGKEKQLAFPVLVALANFVTLWLFSAEILASANSGVFDLADDARENLASLGLSLLWGVYAAVLIVLGLFMRSGRAGRRSWRWVRVAGLALLAVPVVKLFAYDSRTLEQEYRVIAFIALGLILVAGGLLYQRYSRAVRGFFFE